MLDFVPMPTERTRLTHVWDVFSNGLKLGQVSWYAQWRRYCYHPAFRDLVGIILDAECLTELATFCADQTVARKDERVESALHRGEQE
jgi:hypothetical protein